MTARNCCTQATLIPDRLKEACADTGVSAFTDEIRPVIERDGLQFVGFIWNDRDITIDRCELCKPKTRDSPSIIGENGKPRLTVTSADIGAPVEFINFLRVFQNRTVFSIVEWGSTLCSVMSLYKTADLLLMVDAMKKLTVGSAANRNKIENQAYVAYYRDTGLDMWTKKKPDSLNLAWVNGELHRNLRSPVGA